MVHTIDLYDGQAQEGDSEGNCHSLRCNTQGSKRASSHQLLQILKEVVTASPRQFLVFKKLSFDKMVL